MGTRDSVSRLVVLLALLLARAPSLRAQQLTPADSGVVRLLAPDSAVQARAAAAGAELLYWVANTGSDEQTIFVRNTGATPIRITGYEVYECINLAHRLCGMHASKLRIAPGKTARLAHVGPRSFSAAWSYRYRVEARYDIDAGRMATAKDSGSADGQ